MDLAAAKLSEMLSDAFDLGYSGAPEDRDEAISDVLAKHSIRKEDDVPPKKSDALDGDFRLYGTAELRELPPGAMFNHATLGKCKIAKRNGEKYMAFDNPGVAPSAFNLDNYPWDIPMKRIQ